VSVGGGSGLSGTVVIFFGHDVSRTSRNAFRRLRATAGRRVTVRWLLDQASGPEIPPEFRDEILTFDSRQFANWGYGTFGRTMLPGHCHFPLLHLYEQHPGIQHLWLVEYDVRFTGKWKVLFDHFASDDADLVTCHIRARDQEPGWYWWPSLRDPDRQECPNIPHWRAFLVVARYSAAALAKLIEFHRAGWTGHQEVIIPTLLRFSGHKVRDINDASPAHRARRFYISRSEQNGALEEFGTIRYRPASPHAGLRSNTLYHPVKPVYMIRTRPFVAGLLQKLVVVRRMLFGR
jgi:hypothetical protein